jgi:type II secretory ATPase GspE/PulE/Tfp pilus assembly ATPase PilB-like protein
VMQQVRILHRTHWPELSHRIKIMASMNIADTRSLQDGRFDLVVGGTKVDFRVAVMPTSQGENIVIRILDHRRALLPLEKLGFSAASLTQLDHILERPEGIILITGPTGSGKTTTLYSMLTKISSINVNVMTLEEPIEYRLDLIRQTSVREGQGMSFAEGVRGILRQDPDIIFIGEVRDGETAQMALRASMTGHQVFSTLHCNDALGALPRLIDLGLRPRMLSGHVSGVVAQRLVRKLCPQCRTMHPANDGEEHIIHRIVVGAIAQTPRVTTGFAEMQSQSIAPAAQALLVGRPVGCEYCHGTGYRGRLAIAEILRVTPELDELIAADAPRSVLHKQMRSEGFQSMAEDGIAKVLRGEVSLDSLRRAVDLTRVV